MTVREALLGLGILAAVSNVAALILIMAWLDRKGYKTNILLARIFTFRYLAAYKEATKKETGRTGRLYGLWKFTLILMVGLAIAGFLCPRG